MVVRAKWVRVDFCDGLWYNLYMKKRANFIKIFIKSFVLLFIFINIGVVFAGCIPTDKNGYQYSYSYGNQGYTFYIGKNFNVETTNVVIPATFNGKPVVRISEGFRNNYKLNGDGWRTGQTNKIKSISIPASIIYIDTGTSAGVFQDCTDLTEIIISSENPHFKSEGNCVIEITTNKLIATCGESIVPEYITNFSAVAFFGTYISKNVPDDSIFYVNNWAVGYKGTPDKFPSLEPNTIGIADWAFFEWMELESIILPSSITYIGDYAFYRCWSLASIFIPSGVEYIFYKTFYSCPLLTIYAEAEEKPDTWNYYWDQGCPVVWNCSQLPELD